MRGMRNYELGPNSLHETVRVDRKYLVCRSKLAVELCCYIPIHVAIAI